MFVMLGTTQVPQKSTQKNSRLKLLNYSGSEEFQISGVSSTMGQWNSVIKY